MVKPSDDSRIIRPRSVPLSHRSGQARHRRRIRATSLAIGSAFVVLLGIAAWVFLYLPGRVTAPTVVLTPAEPRERARAAAAEADIAPFEATQRERARQQAQASLSRFVELQITLEEDMHVQKWASAEFQEVLATAHQGDRLFIDQKYDEALAHYEAGSEALRELVEYGDRRFESAMREGIDALNALDAARAAAAFASAAEIFPEATPLAEARQRLEVLPRVQAELRAAQRAHDRGDYTAARSHFAAVQQLDPAAPGVRQALGELEGILSDHAFEALLSDGYAALANQRYAAARASFARALERRPNDPAAVDGQRQVREAETLSRIEALRTRAMALVADENWAAAQVTFTEILEIDPNLKFARDGKAQATQMTELTTSIDGILNDPGRLSAPAAFTDAVALFRRAVDITEAFPALTDRLDRMEALLADAAQPVMIELTSDGQTRITVSHVGDIGSFERRTLGLRPGRYVLTGSRDGCRDVRKEVLVGRETQVIDIRCEQRI
jgi:tetratricopeptide (TPR) repeat protein